MPLGLHLDENFWPSTSPAVFFELLLFKFLPHIAQARNILARSRRRALEQGTRTILLVSATLTVLLALLDFGFALLAAGWIRSVRILCALSKEFALSNAIVSKCCGLLCFVRSGTWRGCSAAVIEFFLVLDTGSCKSCRFYFRCAPTADHDGW